MKSKTVNLMIAGAALFAMFFGAGNLIFPVGMGVTAGDNAMPATIGFMITGVLLPVLAMVAAATSENGINGIANRIGRIPGFIFALMAFLATGMLYAIPRTAAVSYSTSIAPRTGDPNGWLGLLVYTFIFFAVAAAMVMNPTKVLDKIGTWLTPALLVLLILLITTAAFTMPHVEPAHLDPKWASTPMLTGLQEGYGTLDAIASFVFGIIVITSLKQRGFKPGKELFKGTAIAGTIAGVILALVYMGLSLVGTKVADKAPVDADGKVDGGAALGIAAFELFGNSGHIVFAAIFILACLTTAIGLISASTAFFLTIFTKCPRNLMIFIHVAVSLAIANLGTATLVAVAIPMMMFCYPITIAITIVCLIDIAIPGHMYWTYRGTVWVSAVFGVFDAANAFLGLTMGDKIPAGWSSFYGLIPLSSYSMGWFLPFLIFGIIGFIVDGKQGRLKEYMEYSDEPVGLIFQKGLTTTAPERMHAKVVAHEEQMHQAEEEQSEEAKA